MAISLNTRICLRNDTAARWAEVNPILKKGEIGVENDTGKFKIGNDESNWNDLDYANSGSDVSVAAHYEGEAAEGETDEAVIARVMGVTAPANDDIFVVKRAINGEKKSYTSYVYNGTAWAAMDGNYNANNVYFDADFVATEKVGTITIPASGSTTVAAAGKNVKEVLASILAQEKNPTVTQPSVSVNITNSTKALEVGSKVIPTYKATFNGGSYSYGPATGITAKTWEITNSVTDETLNTAEGSFAELTVADNTNFSITAKATYEGGAVPKTNIGNEKPNLAIAAGSKSAVSSAKITGYRNFFYGFVASSSADVPVDSALVRSLTAGGAYNAQKSFTIKAADTAGAKRIVVAIPANSTRSGLVSVSLDSTMNLDITAEYNQIANVNVEGANGATAIPYKVWVYEPAELGSDQIQTITLG